MFSAFNKGFLVKFVVLNETPVIYLQGNTATKFTAHSISDRSTHESKSRWIFAHRGVPFILIVRSIFKEMYISYLFFYIFFEDHAQVTDF